MEESDLRWIYAAYRLGALESFPKGLTVPEFVPVLERFVSGFGAAWVAVAKTSRGVSPVGLFLASGPGNVTRAQSVWFPWASPRNKLECTLRLLAGLPEGAGLLAFVPVGEKPFLNHVARYGLARRVGTVEGAFPDGGPAALFQSRRI